MLHELMRSYLYMSMFRCVDIEINLPAVVGHLGFDCRRKPW